MGSPKILSLLKNWHITLNEVLKLINIYVIVIELLFIFNSCLQKKININKTSFYTSDRKLCS